MKIDKSASLEEITEELMNYYKATGKIGVHTPKNKKEAEKIAKAVAHGIKEGDE